MPKEARPLPSLARLRELFSYDPLTGILTRLTSVPKAQIGSAAGTVNAHGGLICRVDYRIFHVHRIVWALHYGEEPPPIIDHINGNRSDNRIQNLRAATASQNSRNRKIDRRNRVGLKGAHWSSSERKWRSSIRAGGKPIHLGWFRTPEAAHEAYCAAAREHHGEFARVG